MSPAETILIIDDDEFLRILVRAFLERMGLNVVEAADGAQGLAALKAAPPALVLLDITMPGMNGFEVCRAIRALPEAADTPVIVMTSLEGTARKVEAFQCGAVDYVSKPLHLEDVEVRVKTHLGIRSQNLELRQSRDQLQEALEASAVLNRNLVEVNEKLRHSEEVKSRFLALMRNEINNPLNGIMGLADLVAGKVPLEKAREFGAMIKDEAFHLDCQIQNVFRAAEVEAGEAAPSISRVNVGSIMDTVVDSFGPYARAKGLKLTATVAGEPGPFPTDGEKVHHILANLVANAIEASGRGGEVAIRAEDLGEHLALQVSDQGLGLPEAEQKILFQFFGTSGFQGVSHGQNLGLPVVKALVDLLGGAIDVDSVPGEGASFRITLPRALETMEADAQDGNLLIFDEPQEF
jgi:signal transduction histidine kinase